MNKIKTKKQAEKSNRKSNK